ncbi:MAG: NepR family anti-sigma factor [Sphingomicrobium sp.]
MSAEKGSDGKGGGDPKKPTKQRSGDLGRALRSVYDDTVRESVPDELLKLLGKLG